MCFFKRRGGLHKVLGFGRPFHFEQNRSSGARTSCSDMDCLSAWFSQFVHYLTNKIQSATSVIPPGPSIARRTSSIEPMRFPLASRIWDPSN